MKLQYQERAMHELCEITSSKRIFAADYQAEGVPFFRGKEITERFNGALGVSTELFISRQKFEEIKEKFGVPEAGDLLLTSVGTLGSTYVVQPEDEFYFKDGNITWFRKFKGLNSNYLHYWLGSPAGKAEQKKCTIGSSQSAYTIVLLKEMKIALPPLEEQERIASILSAYDDLIENNTLLSRFFKGEPYKEFLAEYVQASWLLTKVMNSSTASAQATHLDEYAKNVPSQVRAARIADEYNQRMQRPCSTGAGVNRPGFPR